MAIIFRRLDGNQWKRVGVVESISIRTNHARESAMLKVKLPDGYELACDEMRGPRNGEYFIDARGVVVKATRDRIEESHRVIVRRIWLWPQWLTAPFIAMDANGRWFGYSIEPGICGGIWATPEFFIGLSTLTNFEPPPCDDWRQSLRANPKNLMWIEHGIGNQKSKLHVA